VLDFNTVKKGNIFFLVFMRATDREIPRVERLQKMTLRTVERKPKLTTALPPPPLLFLSSTNGV